MNQEPLILRLYIVDTQLFSRVKHDQNYKMSLDLYPYSCYILNFQTLPKICNKIDGKVPIGSIILSTYSSSIARC